jgi:hypothetical protein
MHFESQIFELPKDVEYPEQNQDAWATDCLRGVAAIADGVATSLFARHWARILTEAAIASPPDPDCQETFRDWLQSCRETWSGRIDASRLAWFQKAKFREGAFSTLLWLMLVDPPEICDASSCRLRGYAVGDSCLFLVREGQTLRAFPISNAVQLEASPMALGSVDLKHDDRVQFERIDEECRPGDLVVLCTDAVAEWAFREQEAGTPADWERFWDMPEDDWQREVAALRQQRRMRYDDTTMLLLRVCVQPGSESVG